MTDDLTKAAKMLVESVEFDVNGLHGKGGHGGLTSDKTLRAASELRVIIDRMENARLKDPASIIAKLEADMAASPVIDVTIIDRSQLAVLGVAISATTQSMSSINGEGQ